MKGHDGNEQYLGASPGAASRPSWPALLLGAIPFVAICFTVGLWDRITPTVAGVPFNIFWLVLWMLLTPLCMWGAYQCERGKDGENQNVVHEEKR